MAFNFSLNGVSGLTGFYSDFANIKSGTYKKLLNAYYSKVQGSQTSEKVSSLNKDSVAVKNEKNALKAVKANADSLGISASNLVEKGAKSVFNKKKVESVNEETGEKTTSMEYDKEKISSAVKQFVSDYNAVIEKSADTDSTKVMSKTLNMIDNTAIYKDSLSKIGISIGSDNKLTVDEEKFAAADMTSVKSLFNDANSFGQRTMQKALQISSEANRDMLSASLYTSKASYQNYDYTSLLNMYL
ncbi:MAG: hypothetical protein J6M02_05620 [Clostridia bacterium]|nr:hypothetical protein [Clostridia bacterium]